MKKQENYLYIKLLRKANHAVFGVDKNGQKLYWNALHRKKVPYSSGQQIKRTIIDTLTDILGEERAAVIMNYAYEGNNIKQKEIIELCNPSYADQLIGGWMLAASEETSDGEKKPTQKRRSPLSISGMFPLHPNLTSYHSEVITNDRSQYYGDKLVLRKGKNEKWKDEEIDQFLKEKDETISKNKFVGEKTRVNGMFVVNIAIDLEKLFRIPITLFDREISKETENELREKGWKSEKIRGVEHLVLPSEKIEEYATAIGGSLVNWLITSNQSRTHDPIPVVSIAISDISHKIQYAITSEMTRINGEAAAKPVINENVRNVKLFTTPIATEDFFKDEITVNPNAIEDAEDEIKQRIIEYYKDSE